MITFYDTSAILNGNIDWETAYIVPLVLTELQELKYKSKDDAKKSYQVREAMRAIDKHDVTICFPNEKKVESYIKKHCLPDNNDMRILVGSMLYNNYSPFITNDFAQYQIGSAWFEDRVIYYGNHTNEPEFQKKVYTGWVKLYLDDKDLADLYSDPKINRFDLKTNQYGKIYNNDELVDVIRWNGNEYVPLRYQRIRNRFMGDISPLDTEQRMLFDMLQNKDIKVQMILGGYGCGKSFIALAHAIDFVQRGLYDGIVFVRNNYQLKDTKDIGALPNGEIDKLYPFLMPIADHVGGTDGLNLLINDHIIQPVHLGFLRGRDIQNKIIFCDECQNMTKQQMQLLIGRISKGSQLWLIGDRRQTDSAVFERNNGIEALTDRLAGDELFGMVKLVESHRSDAAKLADKLD